MKRFFVASRFGSNSGEGRFFGRKANSFDEAPKYLFKSIYTNQDGKIIEAEFIPTRKEMTMERHPKGFRQKEEHSEKQKGVAR